MGNMDKYVVIKRFFFAILFILLAFIIATYIRNKDIESYKKLNREEIKAVRDQYARPRNPIKKPISRKIACNPPLRKIYM